VARVADGRVEALFVCAVAAGEPEAVERAEALAGRGLRGDRYAEGRGTFSNRGGDGRHLTLIAAEALADLAGETGIELAPAGARRNVLTSGVDLDALIGRRFRIGAAECAGRRPCPPCTHLERLAGPGLLRGLADRGGLRADVLRGGPIAVGDPVVVLGKAPPSA
jgi:MOSC domain-containing protein YiiM